MDILTFGGSQLRPLRTIVVELIGTGQVTWLGVLNVEGQKDLVYRATTLPLEAVFDQLAGGRWCSLQLRKEEPQPLLLGVYAPHFVDSPLADWTCVVEAREQTLVPLFELGKNSDGLGFVALTVDEPPDFTTSSPMSESFPWHDWRLKMAAVRRVDGSWEEKRGPAG